jgi:hypothetical protein
MNPGEKPQQKSLTAREHFAQQVENLKSKLPKDWRTRFKLKFTEYDNYTSMVRVSNVYSGSSTDMGVLERMQIIAAEYQKEQKGAQNG